MVVAGIECMCVLGTRFVRLSQSMGPDVCSCCWSSCACFLVHPSWVITSPTGQTPWRILFSGMPLVREKAAIGAYMQDVPMSEVLLVFETRSDTAQALLASWVLEHRCVPSHPFPRLQVLTWKIKSPHNFLNSYRTFKSNSYPLNRIIFQSGDLVLPSRVLEAQWSCVCSAICLMSDRQPSCHCGKH